MNLTTIPFAFAVIAATTAISTAQKTLATANDAAPQERAKEAPQAGGAQAPSRKGRKAFLPHSTMIGHAVTASAGDATVEMGTVADLVLEGTTGMVSHVVIKAGDNSAVAGQLRAIPFANLKWEAALTGDTTATLAMAPRALEAMPAFDPAKLSALAGASAVDAAAKRVDKETKDMNDKDKADQVAKARQATVSAARSFLATGLGGTAVYAPESSDAFAKIGELVVDCGRGTVAFVTVATADAQYLVPFSTLEIQRQPTRDPAAAPTLRILAPTDAAGMEGTPKVEGKLTRMVSQPRFRSKVYAHYGVKAPGAKPKAKDGPKAGPGKSRVGETKNAGKRKPKKIDRKDG